MPNQKPTFTAYTVAKREGKEDYWTAIGAAFMHQDGDGYNIVLQALPLDGKIVLRLPKAAAENDTKAAQQEIRDANDRRKGARRDK
jgi:hypothetical protein